jgi:hypothetical protein
MDHPHFAGELHGVNDAERIALERKGNFKNPRTQP